MRIGLITGEYPPLQGGLSDYTHILATNLKDRGHDVFVFSNDRTQQQSETIPLANTINHWGYQTNRKINYWARDNCLDIVNLQFQTAAFDMSPWIHFMPHMLDKPFVTTFHDLRFPYLFPKAGKIRDWIVMHLANQSDGVIVTNHEDLERVSHLNSTMIPIGSNIPLDNSVDREVWRRKINVSNDDFLIAHFGFINHSKGIDTLLTAIDELADTHIKLLMIGGRKGNADPTNQQYADVIDAMIEHLGLESQVIWTGFVDSQDVSAYLQTADLVVLPFRDGASFRRGSLMAAIAQNCAIATTQPSILIPEFTSDNMVLVDPENSGQLAHAIQELSQDSERRALLQKNIPTLQQHFDWKTIAKQTTMFFEQVLQQ